MLPWSVMAIAGWPSAAAAATASPTRDAPSSIEYSVCWCRWTNESATFFLGSADHNHVIPEYRARSRGVPHDSDVAGSAGAGKGSGPFGDLGAHALQLLAGGDLLGHQGGLDAVEQALEPPH